MCYAPREGKKYEYSVINSRDIDIDSSSNAKLCICFIWW